MNPNYKESLPREWWQTSFQILPTDEVMQRIKDNDPTYKTLDGACRQMQGSRIEMIAQQCIGNTSITEIDLRGNGFDSDGLYALVQALKTMPNVTKLNLRGNSCRNEGVEALGNFLKTNKKITTLNLNENNLGSPGAICIAEALKVSAARAPTDPSPHTQTRPSRRLHPPPPVVLPTCLCARSPRRSTRRSPRSTSRSTTLMTRAPRPSPRPSTPTRRAHPTCMRHHPTCHMPPHRRAFGICAWHGAALACDARAHPTARNFVRAPPSQPQGPWHVWQRD